MKPSDTYVYYCSGHGYGHATRVSAFSCHLLNLREDKRPELYIVSSAPQHVFSEAIARGALYRYADWIDPVIVQPLAYRVDRDKSVQVLKAFLSKKNEFLEVERQWLVETGVRCVLSDAAFLGCLAAKSAGIPSVLITNFTFDSVYSYLSTTFVDEHQAVNNKLHSPSAQHNRESALTDLMVDVPIPSSVLKPLVSQMHQGYRCADLLLLLPGQIPIPSFTSEPCTSLPSYEWVDLKTKRFETDVIEHLNQPCSASTLLPHIPFPANTRLSKKPLERRILQAPLIVRPPSTSPSPYTSEGRAKLLTFIGVPEHLHDPETTKILIVSFGGQIFRKPSRSRNGSRAGSRTHSRSRSKDTNPYKKSQSPVDDQGVGLGLGLSSVTSFGSISSSSSSLSVDDPATKELSTSTELTDHRQINPQPPTSPRLTTSSHIWIPGAPPVSRHASPLLYTKTNPQSPRTSVIGSGLGKEMPTLRTIPPTPMIELEYMSLDAAAEALDNLHVNGEQDSSDSQTQVHTLDPCQCSPEELKKDLGEYFDLPRLLPDDSWIVVVCGVSKEQWEHSSNDHHYGEDSDNDLPDNFYIAPLNVYMPDLLAISDVLLGKLGYGTVSECVDSQTPFVYVSRPLFVEEHGLRMFLEKEGVGVEMEREDYEGGWWADAIEEAVRRDEERFREGGKGRGKKGKRLEEAMVFDERREDVNANGDHQRMNEKMTSFKDPRGMVGIHRRQKEGENLAKHLVQWVEECWAGVDDA
ncbi:hypothetical protein K435DRAFT_974530 [Dendrothele bispora CBS 962.96]|uniref:UDP-N-acetylglucosamine transferase subunit ALG13 n=1 Tax=Dendrothele bispora (strain CBS 962.96) TaxID=1314807 RepID=A0A4S8KLT4_DENBC|nr:hypothetical protein K435DRAFT_974530 [Dendrothele bispora CBS 962.96]